MSYERNPQEVAYEQRLAQEHDRRDRDLEREDRLREFGSEGFPCPPLSGVPAETKEEGK